MPYAQINYPQIQGINGRYTIHDIGCFITAFCNLEEAFGNSVDPLTLNNYFVANNIYIDIDDGVRDDVDWSFVQRWDVNTRVTQLGSSGWPNSNNAIVKFAYTSPRTGHPITHFCKVADYVNQQILDSWDGVVKHISSTVYGQPVAWATYEHSVPQAAPTPVPPAPTITVTPFASAQQFVITGGKLWNLDQPDFNSIVANPVADIPAAPVTITAYLTRSDLPQYVYYLPDANVHHGYNKADCMPYTPPAQPYVAPAGAAKVPLVETYDLVKAVKWYPTADAARKDFDARGVIDKGPYVLIKIDGTARLLAKKNTDNTTYWINDFDNKIEQPVIIAAPEIPTAVLTLPTDPPKPTTEVVDITPQPSVPVKRDIQWGWVNKGQPLTFQYQGHTPVSIKDLEGLKPNLTLAPGTKGPVSRYTQVNGIDYLLPDAQFNKGNCYGIPERLMTQLAPPTILDEVEGDLGRFWDEFIDVPQKAYRLISDISPVKVSHAIQRGKQTIDGFKAGRKK